MSAVRLLLGFVCFVITGSNGLLKRNLLNEGLGVKKETDKEHRLEVVRIAAGEVGVRELSGNNDGERVEEYLAAVGLKKGQPWCAAFVCWVYGRAGYRRPLSGWSPALFPLSRLTKAVLPGDVLGIYIAKMKRIAHVGLVERMDGDWCLSVEGNTNLNGGIEGDGVYRKRRHLKTVYRVADWVRL